MLEFLQPLQEIKIKGHRGRDRNSMLRAESSEEERHESGKKRRVQEITLRNSLRAAVFQTIHISQQRLQMFSSKAHVQLTPFSLEESIFPPAQQPRANTTQLVNRRLQTQLSDMRD